MKKNPYLLLLSLLPLSVSLAYATASDLMPNGSYQAGGARADSQNGIALGNSAHVTAHAHSAAAIGINAKVNESVDGIALGNGAMVQDNADGATAIGSGSHIDSSNVGSNAIGISSHIGTHSDGANAIGDTAGIGQSANGAIAMGSNSTIGDHASNSIAVGAHATVAKATTHAASIGDHSTNRRSHTVSFGNATLQRQLTHVAAGTQTSDAVNLGQLNAVAQTGLAGQQHNSQKIRANANNITQNTQNIQTNTQGIQANTGTIGYNSRNIGENSQTIQRHWQAVNRWQDTVTHHLGAMQHQIDNNRHEMRQIAAKDAALAGLFQPYRVGRFNASAALGGYKDQQAVAVGMGYRFTRQLAAKAGAAFSDNSLEYNVGINYEFN